jgi:hypothetical protein
MEDAVTRQSRREIDCLVRRRQELLTRLSGATLSPNMVALLTTASEAGKRAISSLEASRAALGKRLRDIHQRKRARLAYKAAFVAPRWEHRS